MELLQSIITAAAELQKREDLAEFEAELREADRILWGIVDD